MILFVIVSSSVLLPVSSPSRVGKTRNSSASASFPFLLALEDRAEKTGAQVNINKAAFLVGERGGEKISGKFLPLTAAALRASLPPPPPPLQGLSRSPVFPRHFRGRSSPLFRDCWDHHLGSARSSQDRRAMRCLPFLHGEIKEDPVTKSASVRSFSTTSTERDVRSGSDFNSMNVSDTSAESIRRTQYPSFTDRPSNLRVFSFSELKNATRNFSRSLMVGEGGFGCVYRGIIKTPDEPSEQIEIAVKQLNRKGLQGQKEWLTEMNVLGIVEHTNLVKLIGYCADDDERGVQRLLVYEYMPNGSVDDHLSSRSNSTLSWPMRLKVALDSARGLKYLHEEMDFQVIFRDLKTSNILLDENWNAKLSDFGLARHGPSEGLTHVSTAVVGTLGYAAPEYMQTGRLTAKSDIWSYGVLLYELITGRRPIDRNCPKSEQKLLEWVKPYISDVKRFPIIIDPRLEGHYNLKSMTKLASVANRCLVRMPKSRPKMSEVYEMVKKIVDSIETGTPQPPLHYHCLVSEPGTKGTKKGSLKRRFHEFKFGCSRHIVWRGWRPEIIKTF